MYIATNLSHHSSDLFLTCAFLALPTRNTQMETAAVKLHMLTRTESPLSTGCTWWSVLTGSPWDGTIILFHVCIVCYVACFRPTPAAPRGYISSIYFLSIIKRSTPSPMGILTARCCAVPKIFFLFSTPWWDFLRVAPLG